MRILLKNKLHITITLLIIILFVFIQLTTYKLPSSLDNISCIDSQEFIEDERLKIAIIGDSWVETGDVKIGLSNYFNDTSIVVNSFGQGRASSKVVYENLLSDTIAVFSFKEVLIDNYDYCIIMCGLVDFSQIYGAKFYSKNISKIVNQLNKCGVKPVIISIPLVDLETYYKKQSKSRSLYNLYKKIFIHFSIKNQRSNYTKELKNEIAEKNYTFIEYTDFINEYNSEHIFFQNETHMNSQGLISLGEFIGKRLKSEFHE